MANGFWRNFGVIWNRSFTKFFMISREAKDGSKKESSTHSCQILRSKKRSPKKRSSPQFNAAFCHKKRIFCKKKTFTLACTKKTQPAPILLQLGRMVHLGEKTRVLKKLKQFSVVLRPRSDIIVLVGSRNPKI